MSGLPVGIRTAVGDAVHGSIASGFGAVLGASVLIAALSSGFSWLLIRPAAKR